MLLNSGDVAGVRAFFSGSALCGLGSGLCFAFTALWAREASLSLEASPVISSALTLAVTISIQSALLFVYLFYKEPESFNTLRREWRLGAFVGVLSLVGSIGWFTAFSLQSPALVKTLGQIEFFFALIISMRLFKEKNTRQEYAGMAMILVSVVLLLWI